MSELAIDPSARMQLRGIGDLMHPGACAVCGNGTRPEGFVDIGVYFDYEGQVYLCFMCAEQLAGVIGCLTRDETLLLTQANNELLASNKSLQDKVEQYERFVSNFNDLPQFGITSLDPVPDDLDLEPVKDEQADSSTVGDNSDEPVTEPTAGEPESPEPIKIVKRTRPSRSASSDGSKSDNSVGL